jgi:hypothetical protein
MLTLSEAKKLAKISALTNMFGGEIAVGFMCKELSSAFPNWLWTTGARRGDNIMVDVCDVSHLHNGGPPKIVTVDPEDDETEDDSDEEEASAE